MIPISQVVSLNQHHSLVVESTSQHQHMSQGLYDLIVTQDRWMIMLLVEAGHPPRHGLHVLFVYQCKCVWVGDDIVDFFAVVVVHHDDVFGGRMIYAMRHMTDVPWKMMVRNISHHCYPEPY